MDTYNYMYMYTYMYLYLYVCLYSLTNANSASIITVVNVLRKLVRPVT